MKRKTVLEVCVDSVESAIEAEKGGADRLELCGSLVLGGTTPEASLFKMVRKAVSLPINVMIRPRYGDFCYSDYEFRVMKEGVEFFREQGADGFVIGILLPDGSIDKNRMARILRGKRGATATLHRCFDLSKDPFMALEDAIELGFDTVLTSGQSENCMAGLGLLAELNNAAAGCIRIMAGAVVNASVIGRLYEETGITAFHMSGKRMMESRMAFRREGVPMGVPQVPEYGISVTDKHKVAAERASAQARIRNPTVLKKVPFPVLQAHSDNP